MRIVVTGGAGFVGRAVVERLAARGDTVVALVRDPSTAAHIAGDHVELARSGLDDVEAMAVTMAGADAVVHGAGSYRVGLRTEVERRAMWDANVGTTERVLDAALEAGVPRVLYVSTLNVFGNTRGTVVDETHRRVLGEGFVSWYDETKFKAHEAATIRLARGTPVVIGMPGQAYGPHDHAMASAQLARAHAGTLRYVSLADLGVAWVHVHDLADGLVAALDRGRIGEMYSLGGECRRFGESIAIAARVGGRRPPALHVPTAMLRLTAPLSDAVGGLPGIPAGLGEMIRAGDGVTYWARHEKATAELGFAPRGLEQGIADTWGRTA